jgi:tetratricopeptide (TPR) repeat protein
MRKQSVVKMLLQHFSKLTRNGVSMWCVSQLLLCAMILSGCASGPKPAKTDAAADRSERQASIEERLANVPTKALTMFEQAAAIMAAGDTVDAELRFKEFVLQYPGYPGAYVNLAILSAQAGDDQAAEGFITDALIIDPEHPAALNQLGMLLRRQGKIIEAESAYLKAVTASPDYALAHYNLGVLNELYLQRLDVALQHFERYQEIEGEDKQVTKWIADLKRRIDAQQRTAKVAK